MKKEHNGIISFWKFMFSLLIVALHVGLFFPNEKYRFNAGSIGVDFFFIVSGYLFYKKCINIKDNDNRNMGNKAIIFVIKKIKSFFPYIFVYFFMLIPFCIFIKRFKAIDYISGLYNFLYVPINGLAKYDVFGIVWYIVVMIIVEMIFFPVIVKYKENFSYIFSPLIVYFGSNYLFINFNTFAVPWVNDIFSYAGIIRGIVGINAGIIAYLISQKLNKLKLTDFSRFFITIFELIGFVSIFIISNKASAHVKYDCLMLIILIISISLAFSEKSLLFQISKNKLFFFLEKLSLPIYINQWLLIFLIKFILDKYSINLTYYMLLIIVIMVSVVVAFITQLLVDLLIKNKYKIKKIFISD